MVLLSAVGDDAMSLLDSRKQPPIAKAPCSPQDEELHLGPPLPKPALGFESPLI
jgi:hypothetical protein